MDWGNAECNEQPHHMHIFTRARKIDHRHKHRTSLSPVAFSHLSSLQPVPLPIPAGILAQTHFNSLLRMLVASCHINARGALAVPVYLRLPILLTDTALIAGSQSRPARAQFNLHRSGSTPSHATLSPREILSCLPMQCRAVCQSQSEQMTIHL